MDSPSTPAPDEKRLFLGLEDKQSYTFVQELQNMAAANLIAQVLSRLDAQNALIAAQSAKVARSGCK